MRRHNNKTHGQQHLCLLFHLGGVLFPDSLPSQPTTHYHWYHSSRATYSGMSLPPKKRPRKGHTDALPASTQKNAFAVLLAASQSPTVATKKKRKESIPSTTSTKIRFIACPAGCGQHVAVHNVNRHLDTCLQSQQPSAKETDKAVPLETATAFSSVMQHDETNESYQSQLIHSPSDKQKASAAPRPETDGTSHSINTPHNQVTPSQSAEKALPLKSSVSSPPLTSIEYKDNDDNVAGPTTTAPVEHTETTLKAATPTEAVLSTPDATRNPLFAHMMARSKKVFQSKAQSDAVLECWFWFSPTDGVSLQWTAPSSPPTWTATVQLRQGPLVHLVTSVPSDRQQRRYCRHHSRLSVPVLKSILQKSIRRRKPLPAVRVALELADKSLGDFLRRLPIIVLEDSTLHPDLGMLVWLMMAQSKEYEPSAAAMEGVFRVVFEMASCQWQDCLAQSGNGESVDYTTVMDEIKQVQEAASLDQSRRPTLTVLTCVWSMLARASYGGMQGDVQMLYAFAALWRNRVQSKEFASLAPVQDMCTWSEVPVSIHRRAREQSTQAPGLFTNLLHTGIDYLQFQDITVEGVDFHCSAVIDTLRNDHDLVQLSTDLMILSNEEGFPEGSHERLEWLCRIWKSCMWDYGSGVNHRRPLIVQSGDLKHNKTNKYEHVWKSLAAKRALEFQMAYVQDRLFVRKSSAN